MSDDILNGVGDDQEAPYPTMMGTAMPRVHAPNGLKKSEVWTMLIFCSLGGLIALMLICHFIMDSGCRCSSRIWSPRADREEPLLKDDATDHEARESVILGQGGTS